METWLLLPALGPGFEQDRRKRQEQLTKAVNHGAADKGGDHPPEDQRCWDGTGNEHTDDPMDTPRTWSTFPVRRDDRTLDGGSCVTASI